MKTLILILVLFSLFTQHIVSANYRFPFEDNLDLKFSQTWHAQGLYYNSSHNWVSGDNYAIDVQRSDTSVANIVSPEDGVVTHKDVCNYSTNLVIEFNGYEMQFYHLDKNHVNVSNGQTVTKGQKLGELYSGPFSDGCGNSDGTHLHLRFESKQGTNDPDRITMSGYYFDEYDQGTSGCMMHRQENGQTVTYCYIGYGTPIIFTANEQSGCSGSNPILQGNYNNYSCSASGTIMIQSESNITGESRFYIQ